ncbi:MAG: hypothetical protein RL677_964 [Actinomycetota bacterium]
MTQSAKRIGLFGGSFDPIHNGHLAVANQVLSDSLVDEVIFVPVGLPWQKAKPSATAVHRKAMLELVIKDNSKFKLSTKELERDGISYTIDTVEEFLKEDINLEINLILGVDAARSISTWHQAKELINLVKILVIARGEQNPPNLDFDFLFVKMPLVDISSSGVRDNLKKGLAINYLVPKEVATYISDHNLYKNSDVR